MTNKTTNWSRRKNQWLAKVFTAVPGLASRWGEKMKEAGGAVPWTEPRVPLQSARVAVITTGGVHLASQQPFDMEDPEGDPSFREIPAAAAREEFRITHDYYNHKDADRDVNLVLPVDRLAELAERGVIGGLHGTAYSFMGHIDGRHVETLNKKTGPAVAKALAEAEVDYAVLVPA